MNDRSKDSLDDDWADWAERESARLRRERDAGWDAAAERMVDELAHDTAGHGGN